MKKKHEPDTSFARSSEYPPIGDALDAIKKGFEHISMNFKAITLPPETIKWIEDCNKVKKKFPKREPKPPKPV